MSVLSFWACTEIEFPGEAPFEEILPGDEIMFTSFVPDNVVTRSTMKQDFLDEIKNSYKAVNSKYSFTVKMLKYNEGADPSVIGTALYAPLADASGNGFAGDGTLVYSDAEHLLRWEDNTNRYGFEVTAGSQTLQISQDTEESLLAQDLLKGYSYEPLWFGTDDNGVSQDDIDNVNYRTSKDWYAANKQVYESYGQMPLSTDDLKKIPLFIKHQRSLVTVILKADEGVGRDQLKYSMAKDNIATRINSYSGGTQKSVIPLLEGTTINYTSQDYGGAANNVETVMYHAIVEPHDYLEQASDQAVCTVSLSGQKFTFYAANDKDYNTYLSEHASGSLQSAEAKRVADAYNLKPGQHLVLTVTLSRESRKIVITAYVEDWTEKVTSTICDDYGKNGDPELIETRDKLLAFLRDYSKNKSGTVAIVSPTAIDLEKDDDGNASAWPGDLELRCMLNLAGSVISTEHQMFFKMSESASLVNGTVLVKSGSTVISAVSSENSGTIERVNAMTEYSAADGTPLTPATATKAGLVGTNYGTIYQCSSDIPVYGTAGYVGGIAAESLQKSGSSRQPVISFCEVTARVDGDSNVTAAGGIVGNAVGRVSDNSFVYGISVSQDTERFLNIIGHNAGQTGDITASDNSWPTTIPNAIAGANVNPNARYAGVVSNQEELRTVLMSGAYNKPESRILLAQDFTVSSDYWDCGKQDATLDIISNGNMLFALDGNDKTITLTGTRTVTVDGQTYNTAPMLFTNIQNNISDLTIVVAESLIATPSTSTDAHGNTFNDGIDAIAPLGYSLYAAKLTNVKVKTEAGKYIQAAMPAGIVAWAYGGAKFEKCEVKATIKTWLPSSVETQSLKYAGGIAALAETAVFSQCMFHSATGTLTENRPESTTVYCGGILGGVARRNNTSTVTPLVSIRDCASQFSQTSTKKGAIIGASFYFTGSSSGEQRADGLDHSELSKCEGNWWGSSHRGVGTTYNGMSDAKALGTRNSVDPTFKDF